MQTSWRHRTAALLLCAAISPGGGGVAGAPVDAGQDRAAAPIDDPEAYAVHAALLADLVPSHRDGPLIVQAETVTSSHYDSCLRVPAERLGGWRWREEVEDFKAALEEVRTVLPGREIGAPYVVVPSSEIEDAFGAAQPPAGWPDFYEHFPGARGLMRVSPVTFNSAKTLAVVYAQVIWAPMGGEGAVRIFLKIDGVWTPMDSGCRWIA